MNAVMLGAINEIMGLPTRYWPLPNGRSRHAWRKPTTRQREALNRLFHFTKSVDKYGRWYNVWELKAENENEPNGLMESHYYNNLTTTYRTEFDE